MELGARDAAGCTVAVDRRSVGVDDSSASICAICIASEGLGSCWE